MSVKPLRMFFMCDALSGGVEDDDVDTFHLIEPAGYGAACISGGSDEYGDGLVVIFYKIAQAAAHEPGAYVFEGQCRSME